MKKNQKKLFVTVIAIVMVLCVAVSLAACNEESAPVKVSAVYTADPQAGGAKYLTAPMKMVLTNVETLTVYDNGTYCLSVATTVVTGIDSAFQGTGEVINRGATVVTYYGSLTSTEDSGIITYTLSKPERITVTNNNTLLTGGLAVGFYDTANWTEDDTTAFTAVKGFFGVTEEDGKVDLDTFNSKFSFENKEIAIINGMFEYVNVSYHNVLLNF